MKKTKLGKQTTREFTSCAKYLLNGDHIKPLTTKQLSQEELEQTIIIHSLYGVVIEANESPFPLALDKVNEREGIVDEPFVLD